MLTGIPDDSYKGLGCKKSSGQNKIQFLPPHDMGYKIDSHIHIYIYIYIYIYMCIYISHSAIFVMFPSLPPNVVEYGCHR